MRVTGTRAGAALVAIAAVVGALAVSGCGSSKASHRDVASVSGISDPVARAASVSNAAGGYKMDFTMAIKSPSLPSAMTANGNGAFNTGNRTGLVNLAMDFGSIPGVSQALGSSTLSMQEILSGTTVYIKFPSALMDRLPGDHKEWMSVDLAQIGSAAGIPGLGSLINNPTSSNPAAMLQYLRAVSGGVTKVGTATVNGYPTTEYRATIDFAKYPSVVPPAQRAQARRAIAAVEKLAKVKAFPVEVWIDANHLVRRLQFTFDETLASVGQSVQTQMTLDMTGYGPQPTPKIPPASDVMSMNALLGAAGGALAGG